MEGGARAGRTSRAGAGPRTLVWFRGKDLRLADHPALASARERSPGNLVLLFVLDPYFFSPGRAQQTPHRVQFLLESIADLSERVSARGSRLLLASGKSHEFLPELVRRWHIERIVAQRWVWPLGRERDRRVRENVGVPFDLFEGETLIEPGSLRTTGGGPYSVFTPFARAATQVEIKHPLPAPRALHAPPPEIDQDPLGRAILPSLADLGLHPNPALQRGGESAARDRLAAFLKTRAPRYDAARDRMDLDATSRLSSDLKFGTLSVRELWHRTRDLPDPARDTFHNELLWREFAHTTLWDRPELLERPFRESFIDFPWRDDPAGWRAWVEGQTGYPIVDAAARQLLAEGFIHNRARMIAASFLTKHLLINFRLGEAHYMRLLTDGDLANNDLGWQWSAGCGCDAQPYFRIFNPVTQGKKFDPDGDYVRRWVPELAKLDEKHIHAPWAAAEHELRAAGVVLGVDYPRPIVEHAEARARFLEVARGHLG